VILWPWPLTFWPQNHITCRISQVSPYTKFEHFGIFRFRVIVQSDAETDAAKRFTPATVVCVSNYQDQILKQCHYCRSSEEQLAVYGMLLSTREWWALCERMQRLVVLTSHRLATSGGNVTATAPMPRSVALESRFQFIRWRALATVGILIHLQTVSTARTRHRWVSWLKCKTSNYLNLYAVLSTVFIICCHLKENVIIWETDVTLTNWLFINFNELDAVS